jgi:hypothetical protein
MTMDGCEQCMPSWQAGKTWADCDLLQVYSYLCYQMPGAWRVGVARRGGWILLHCCQWLACACAVAQPAQPPRRHDSAPPAPDTACQQPQQR